MTDGIWLKDPGTPPDVGWQYPAISGENIKASCWDQLCGKVAQHYRTNGRAVPTCDEVTKWVCDNLTVPCYEGRKPYRNTYTDPPSYAQRGMRSPNWPLILMPLKLLAQTGDRGLGDIALRVIGPVTSDAFKAWHLAVFGKPCGCSARQENWNRDFPL